MAPAFFHGVFVTGAAIGGDRIALQQVCVAHASGAVHFGAVVHAAQLGSAGLIEESAAVFIFEDEERVVFAFGYVAVQLGRKLSINGGDCRPPEHPARKFDAVAAHIGQHATARLIDVPKVRRVRAIMSFGLFN